MQDPKLYHRVIPRDLFNEASLLKCYGQLYLRLETSTCAVLQHLDHAPFAIEQDPGDGSLTIGNIVLRVRGVYCHLSRPLNSREPWPLYCRLPDHEEFPVFDEHGELSPEFHKLIAEGKEETK